MCTAPAKYYRFCRKAGPQTIREALYLSTHTYLLVVEEMDVDNGKNSATIRISTILGEALNILGNARILSDFACFR